MRRKFGVAVLLGGLLALALLAAGCGSSESSSSSTGGGSTGGSGATSGSGESSESNGVSTGNTGKLDEMEEIRCGSKPAIVGVIDGYGLNTWSKTVRAEAEAEVAECPNLSMKYVAAKGDLQAQNAAVNTLKVQGAKVIAITPDAGPGSAALPAMRAAQAGGVQVVVFDTDPEGELGKDYLDYTDSDQAGDGEAWANWVANVLGPKGGNVVFLGGPAGNSATLARFAGIKKVFAENPQLKLLTPEPVATEWDAPSEQQAMSGLLAKYPKIDAVISDLGAAAQGAITAFESANRPLVPMVSYDDNGLSCSFEKLKAENPDYEYAANSTRSWMVRVAIRKGVAAYEGEPNQEPSIFDLGLTEDSTSKDPKLAPAKHCLKDAPEDMSPSAMLDPEEIQEAFGE